MEAKNRLTLKELARHPWLNPEDAPSTPLQTSSILGQSKTTASALKQTFHAFYEATRTGFTLGDVSRAPLAKRRQHKRGLSPRNGGTEKEEGGEGQGTQGGGRDGDDRLRGRGRDEGSISSSLGSTESYSTSISDSLTPVAACTRPSKLDLNLSSYET